MSGPRALVPGGALDAPTVRLEGERFHHLTHVLRLGVGDVVELFDGAGTAAEGEIVTVDATGVTLRRGAVRQAAGDDGPRLVLLAAELKGDRFDWVIQKATELGVDEIVPVAFARSVPRPTAEARVRRHARRLRIVEEAGRQCRAGRLPDLRETTTLEAALAAAAPTLGLCCHEEARGGPGLQERLAGAPTDGRLVILTGPEGGLAPEEVEAAKAAGFLLAGLGPRILRAETAAVAAVALAAARFGRLG